MTLDITTQGLIDQAAHAADTAGDSILALRYVARSFRLSFSEQAVRSSFAWSAENASDHIATIGEQVGLAFTSIAANPKKIDAFACPLILVRPDGQTLVIESLSQDGTAEFVSFSRTETDRNEMPLTQLLEPGARLWKVRPRRSLPDARIDAYIAPARKNWLRKILFPSLAPYLTVILASVMVNMLGLSGILFSTQVYDRVIPAQSMNTLAVLFGGVAIAYTFEFLLRVLRGVLLDKLGQDAGQSLSNLVFGRALRIRSDRRPASTGSFISQMRDIDKMREVLTSTSVGVVMDLPFFLLFCFIFWMIAGQLIVIPLVALLVILVPGLVLQPKLKSAAQQAQRESALRNAVLVEAIQGIDDIKALQAEERFQGIWRQTSAVTAKQQSREQRLISGLMSWTQIVQQSVYAGVVALGAPLVMAGDITTGTLVGASILGARMMAPMSQISSVLARVQQARIGAAGLKGIVDLPLDYAEDETRVSLSRINGDYVFENAVFKHRPDLPEALNVAGLQINAGERIGILGRNGAGKSSLLAAMSGQMQAETGQLRLDSISMNTLDPADLRRDVSLLSQTSHLFYGTLRENLLMGNPTATDDELNLALNAAGGDGFLNRFAKGWDYQILEGGAGMSGGQRQSILLARILIRNPSVLLLDEPTSAMDSTTEKQFIAHLAYASTGRTLVIATHRQSVLQLVDRLLIVDKGRIILDGPRDDVLRKMQEQKQ
ncbi:type I secretion system permease/ATPase [Sulfitobacter sp. CW3]|uniref:type I secretion system permease/ATPase n=1 Tax=Sulfitobacter sp. CW3 TaxID=2861965 RepID=UPI001C5D1294|nr:type I secretion system permease/ATPase [Sulfitobacter sp. CW3]MBW4960679.1 type I secretion system permease/ATPase [Sulfitobacter sp. CW3]